MPFSFDPTTGRYRDANGTLVREDSIRRALDQVLAAEAKTMRDLTQSLVDGRLTLAGWQGAMLQEIKSAHLVGATLATGGWAQMDQSDFGFVGQRIRSQYAYLRGFAADIAAGRQQLNGSALSRSMLYAESARQTHRAAIARLAQQRGLELEANQLGSADHCPGCLAATARGWVPIGSLVPCGSRNCMSRCRCSIVYRLAPAQQAA